MSRLVRAMLSFDGLRRVKVERCGKDVKKDAESSEKDSQLYGWMGPLQQLQHSLHGMDSSKNDAVKGWESVCKAGLVRLPHGYSAAAPLDRLEIRLAPLVASC